MGVVLYEVGVVKGCVCGCVYSLTTRRPSMCCSRWCSSTSSIVWRWRETRPLAGSPATDRESYLGDFSVQVKVYVSLFQCLNIRRSKKKSRSIHDLRSERTE